VTRDRTTTNWIVLYASATPPTLDVGAAYLDRRHRALGSFGIGYHHVIRRDGAVEPGRKESTAGAHDPALNATSVAVCLIGGVAADGTPEDNFTAEQWAATAVLVLRLQSAYPDAEQRLGRGFPTNKGETSEPA
jgi:N-acetylmuramoyl-L-alanine amidase